MWVLFVKPMSPKSPCLSEKQSDFYHAVKIAETNMRLNRF